MTKKYMYRWATCAKYLPDKAVRMRLWLHCVCVHAHTLTGTARAPARAMGTHFTACPRAVGVEVEIMCHVHEYTRASTVDLRSRSRQLEKN